MNKAVIVLLSSVMVGVVNASLFYYALTGMWIDNAGVIAVLVGLMMFGLSLPVFHKHIKV